MIRRHPSLRRSIAIVVAFTLTGCAQGPARLARGSDIAKPASSGDQLVAALLKQCEVSRVPESTEEQSKRDACARADTAAGQPGSVGRVPVRVP